MNPGTIRATAQLCIEFMAGDTIEAACIEAVRIARTVGCMVVFDFNGVHCMARTETDAMALAQRCLDAMGKPPAAYKVAGP